MSNKYVDCIKILFKSSTVPRTDWIYVAFSIFVTVIRNPNSITDNTKQKSHFLSDYLPHKIIMKSPKGLYFIARPKYEDLARFLFSSTVAKWEPLDEIKVKEKDIVIDVGANVGYYTLKWASDVGENGKVVAIEADPNSCEILKENCRLNKISNVEIFNYAASEKKEIVTLYTSKTHSGTNSIFSSKAKNSSIKVSSITLDELLSDNFLEINWIKIDVEGAELQVLKGSSKILQKTQNIIIELHEHILNQNGQKPQDIMDILKERGFKTKLFIEHWNEKTSPNKTLKSDYILGQR